MSDDMYERKMVVTVRTHNYVSDQKVRDLKSKVAAALNTAIPNPLQIVEGGGYFLVSQDTGDVVYERCSDAGWTTGGTRW